MREHKGGHPIQGADGLSTAAASERSLVRCLLDPRAAVGAVAVGAVCDVFKGALAAVTLTVERRPLLVAVHAFVHAALTVVQAATVVVCVHSE